MRCLITGLLDELMNKFLKNYVAVFPRASAVRLCVSLSLSLLALAGHNGQIEISRTHKKAHERLHGVFETVEEAVGAGEPGTATLGVEQAQLPLGWAVEVNVED